MYIAVISILLIIALLLKYHFDFKIEEASFISMMLIILILTITGIFKIMHIGQWIIYAIALGSLIALGYFFINKRYQLDVTEVVTPGLVIVILAFGIYFIATRNCVLYIWDEARLYGTTAHYMHATDAISNGGSVTVFSYFFTKITGYSEHALYVSRWLLIWICAVLPLASVKWDKWYMAAIYAILAFGVITLIDPEPEYLMDSVIGVAAGGGIAYLSVCRKKSRPFVLISMSALVLTIKDNVGLIMFAFMLLFMVAYYLVELNKKKWELSKEDIKHTCIFIISIIAALVIKRLTVPAMLLTAIKIKDFIPIIILAFVFVAAFLVWTIWLRKVYYHRIYTRIKQTKLQKVIKIIGLSLIPLVLFCIFYKVSWWILQPLNVGLKQDFIYGLNQYFNSQYFGFSLAAFIVLMFIATVIGIITLVKKERRSSIVAQSLSIILAIIIYGFVNAVLFTSVYHYYLSYENMMGLDRYIGSLVIMIAMWLLALAFSNSGYWIDSKKQYIVSLAISLLIVRCMPLPGETMFQAVMNPNMYAYKYNVRPKIFDHASIVKENTPEDAKVLIIAQQSIGNDNVFELVGMNAQYWMHYEMVPRPLPDIMSVAPPSTELADDETVNMTKEEFKELVKKYDYIYIGNANKVFYSYYGDLFAQEEQSDTKALYQWSGELLELVYMD